MDIALKQRLVGASVLIALAVIVLPMLLGGRPEGTIAEAPKIEISPEPPELEFETRRYPVGEEPPAPAPEPSQSAPLSLPKPARIEVGEQEPATDPVREMTEQGTPGPTSEDGSMPEAGGQPGAAEDSRTPPAAPAPDIHEDGEGRYAVQVASFGSKDNARRLSEKLAGLGYAVLNDIIRSDVGTLNRVRVGPYPTEAAAKEAVTRLQAQIDGIKPRVVDLQPQKAGPVTEPSDPLVRWVVQVGSFSSAANADGLVARLRLEGHSAYSEAVTGSGSTIYRVRVGPFVRREDAQRADLQINERLSLDGVVMSAD